MSEDGAKYEDEEEFRAAQECQNNGGYGATTTASLIEPRNGDAKYDLRHDHYHDHGHAKAKWRDVIGFFIFGLLADALPGFFFSATIIKALDIPDDNAAVLSLSADIGGVVGAFSAALVLRRFQPGTRIVINASLQALGILLSWVLSYPGNMVGLSILTVGFIGMLGTILPLTSYKPKVVTRSYQFGFSGAPILGIAVVEFGDAVGMSSNGLFAIAMCVPVLLCLVFFFVIDRSSFIGANAQRENSTDNEEERDSKQVDQSISFADFEDSSLARADMIEAIKEILWTYWPIYILAFALYKFYITSAAVYFYSSSATFDGRDPVLAYNNITLATHVFVFFLGILAMVPRLSRGHWAILWAPVIILVSLVTAVVLGLHGHFPPLGLGGAFGVAVSVVGCFYYVQLFTPLIMRNDRNITPRYFEFQLQTLVVVYNIVYLSVDLIASFWAAPAILEACRENYEEVYNGVSCTF